METNDSINKTNQTNNQRTLLELCASSCQKVLALMKRTRHSLMEEFEAGFHTPSHLLRLALNEAEALAWESGFPQLVFPELATEKARATAAWVNHQQAIRATR